MRGTRTRIHDVRTGLAILRQEKGLTQSQLSRYSGLDLDYIREIENGTIDPELVSILTLANALDIDVIDLFDY